MLPLTTLQADREGAKAARKKHREGAGERDARRQEEPLALAPRRLAKPLEPLLEARLAVRERGRQLSALVRLDDAADDLRNRKMPGCRQNARLSAGVVTPCIRPPNPIVRASAKSLTCGADARLSAECQAVGRTPGCQLTAVALRECTLGRAWTAK